MKDVPGWTRDALLPEIVGFDVEVEAWHCRFWISEPIRSQISNIRSQKILHQISKNFAPRRFENLRGAFHPVQALRAAPRKNGRTFTNPAGSL